MLDARRLLFTIIGAIVAFIVFMAIAFYIYPIINPDAEYDGGAIGTIGYNPVDFAEFGPNVVAELKNRVSELERQLDDATRKNIDYAEQVETMNQQMAGGGLDPNGMGSGTGLNGGLVAGAGDFTGLSPAPLNPDGSFGFRADSVIKHVKAIFALDEDEMSPIVNGLTDPQLLEIYQQASNRQREQLLRTLAPNRASNLIKRVMS